MGIQRDPLTSDTSFKWVDGSSVPAATTSAENFSNWYTDGSPRDASSGKHCVLFLHNRDGQTPRAPYGWTDPESGWEGDYIRGAWQSHDCNTRDRVVCDLSS